VFENIFTHDTKTALRLSSNENISYIQLFNLSVELKAKLQSSEVAIILCKNNLESLLAYVTCLNNGLVPILLEYEINESKLNDFVERYNVKYLFTDRAKTDIKAFKVIHQFESYYIHEHKNYSLKGKIDPDIALLITTSGSTGNPKLVKISKNNLSSNTQSISKYLSISSIDSQITTLPMQYTFGLSILNTHLINGGTVILTDHSIMEKSFWDLFFETQPTSISGVPYTLNMLKRLKFFDKDISSIKKITQAGGRLSEDLALYFAKESKKRNILFYIMYGQSEATARMSYLPPELVVDNPNSVGIAIPGGKFWIEDSEGKIETNHSTDGELVYKGDNVFMGYAESFKDLRNSFNRSNVLKTGDIARINQKGLVFIVGRKKRFIKLFGNRINLDDIEKFLSSKGINALATGNDDKLKIFFEFKENLDPQDLKKEVSRFIKIHPSAISVIGKDAFPRLQSGKVDYNSLPNG
tara:strand:+ start:304 stop:1710 length:1407 start_codon:yes stop_codon:yes gene_type:complete